MSTFRCSDTTICISPSLGFEDTNFSLFKYLREHFPQIPLWKVLQGKKLVVTGQATSDLCHVKYKVVTGALMPKATDDGAQHGKNYLFISDGTITVNIGADVTSIFDIDVANNPQGVTTFPWEKASPPRYKMHWLGFMIGEGSSSHADIDEIQVRIWQNEISVLGKDQIWISIKHFPFPLSGTQNRPFLWKEPIVIEEGIELRTEISAHNSNVGAQDVQIIANHLFLVERL